MTYCYTYRSLYCPSLIRETSSCSRWQLAQRPTTGQDVEKRRLPSVQSWLNVNVKHFPSRLRGLSRRGWKDFKRQRWWMTSKQLIFPGITGKIHIQIHSSCDNIHKTVQDQAGEPLAFNCWQGKEISLLLMVWYLVYWPHSGKGLTPRPCPWVFLGTPRHLHHFTLTKR